MTDKLKTNKLTSGYSITYVTKEFEGEKWVPLTQAYKLQDRILYLERRIRAEESYDPTTVLREEIEFLNNKIAGLERELEELTYDQDNY